MGSEVEAMKEEEEEEEEEEEKEEVMFGNWILISEVKNVGAERAIPEENGEVNNNHHQQQQPQQDFTSPRPNTNDTFNSSGLETPKETLFDSFAPPASDKFLLAPHHYKYRQELRNHVVRRLDFTRDDLSSNVVVEAEVDKSWCSSSHDKKEEDEDEDEEEQLLFEIVYVSIMDAILLDAKGEAPTTPKSAPLLDGIAYTCPAPPIKPSTTHHRFIIDKEICKKLDF